MAASAARRARRASLASMGRQLIWTPRSEEERMADACRRAESECMVDKDIRLLLASEESKGDRVHLTTRASRILYARDVRGVDGDGAWDQRLDCSDCVYERSCPGDKCRRMTSTS